MIIFNVTIVYSLLNVEFKQNREKLENIRAQAIKKDVLAHVKTALEFVK